MTDLPITIADIEAAAQRIEGWAVRTPLLEFPHLNQRVGGRVLIKPEPLQRTGSFKFRGGFNRLSALSEEERKRGVVAFSSGNHAQGVAHAAEILGIKATIVMPKDAPQLKIDGTRGYGATVRLYDRYNESREAIADQIAHDTGAIVVPSFDDRYIMAGQGTTGLEMADQAAALAASPDQALICCGGGGLSSGSFLALRQRFPLIGCYTVEPDNFDDAKRSLETGRQEKVDPDARSLCDALLTPSAGLMPLTVLRALGASGLSVSDDEAMAAVSFAARRLKLVVEPGGAVALAAVLFGKVELADKVTLIVLSGGNIDPGRLDQALSLFPDS